MVFDVRRVARFLTLAAAVVLLAVPSTAQAQTTLRWKFAKGDKLKYTLAQKVTTVGSTAGMEITTTSDVIMDIRWEVKAVDASGAADMTQTIDRVRFKMTAPL